MCLCGDSQCSQCGSLQGTLERRYIIESRWPAWAAWKPVTAAPHGERWPFDPKCHALVFDSLEDAELAAVQARQWNAGEFRVMELHGEIGYGRASTDPNDTRIRWEYTATEVN